VFAAPAGNKAVFPPLHAGCSGFRDRIRYRGASISSGASFFMSRLDQLDLTCCIADRKAYASRLKALQLSLLRYQYLLKDLRRSLIVVFEGPDAAGKGGIIKRMGAKLDPRYIRVYSIVKPTAEEYRHHYLWRFWKKLPAYGETVVFDRSWYGRVLVERVEKFATEAEWKRAYREINEFERVLLDDGVIILKFYLHFSKKEQLRRFRKREADPYKHWKISEEDWRNRRKWQKHNDAAEEMFKLTDQSSAPWHVIASEDKRYARVKSLELLVERLKKELGPI
jgi:AMP-polyphosphate phosphotransferase